MRNTLVIAEAGVNHNGNIAIGRDLIDIAISAGADIVKFQTFTAESLSTRHADLASYQKITTKSDGTQYDMLKSLELTHEMHLELMAYAKSRGIQFLSTAFDIEAALYLKSLGQDLFKIPSGEITNLPYLRKIGGIASEVILSTGMSTMHEISDAINILEAAGLLRQKITVLHCTTEYPAPYEEINLLAMNEIKEQLGVSVGYSDHSEGIEVAIAAVALGASVIEKHFTVDKSLPGPDHKASLEPLELLRMIRSIRNIEKSLGNNQKKPSKSEIKNKNSIRKSIVAIKKIKAGELLTDQNIGIKRPGTGISPMLWDSYVNTMANRNYEVDDLI